MASGPRDRPWRKPSRLFAVAAALAAVGLGLAGSVQEDEAGRGPSAPRPSKPLAGAQAGIAKRLIPFARPQLKPREVAPSRDAVVVDLSWRDWGRRAALGLGTARVNTCDPSCADGRIARQQGARVTLTELRPGSCRGTAARFYTRAHIAWPPGLGLPARQPVRLIPRCSGKPPERSR